jgi:hypothetical protein
LLTAQMLYYTRFLTLATYPFFRLDCSLSLGKGNWLIRWTFTKGVLSVCLSKLAIRAMLTLKSPTLIKSEHYGEHVLHLPYFSVEVRCCKLCGFKIFRNLCFNLYMHTWHLRPESMNAYGCKCMYTYIEYGLTCLNC